MYICIKVIYNYIFFEISINIIIQIQKKLSTTYIQMQNYSTDIIFLKLIPFKFSYFLNTILIILFLD